MGAGWQGVSSDRFLDIEKDEEALLLQSTSGLLPFFAIVHCQCIKSPAKG